MVKTHRRPRRKPMPVEVFFSYEGFRPDRERYVIGLNRIDGSGFDFTSGRRDLNVRFESIDEYRKESLRIMRHFRCSQFRCIRVEY